MTKQITYRGFYLKPTIDGVYDYLLIDKEDTIRGFVDIRDGKIMIERANGNIYRGTDFEIVLDELIAKEVM